MAIEDHDTRPMQPARARDGHYYAKDGAVWKAPVETDNGDGTKSISLGFIVCTMEETVGDDAAATVAELMNAGTAALKADTTEKEG